MAHSARGAETKGSQRSPRDGPRLRRSPGGDTKRCSSVPESSTSDPVRPYPRRSQGEKSPTGRGQCEKQNGGPSRGGRERQRRRPKSQKIGYVAFRRSARADPEARAPMSPKPRLRSVNAPGGNPVRNPQKGEDSGDAPRVSETHAQEPCRQPQRAGFPKGIPDRS